MNIFFLSAGIATAAICLVHIVIGGKEAIRPLMAARDFGDEARYLNYYCWHIVSIAIAFIAAGFIYAGGLGGGRDIAWAATAACTLFAAWSLIMIGVHGLKPFAFPQWLLFLFVGTIGLVGLTT